MLWMIAVLSMFVGAALAITQTDIKRPLAYSSVAHTGLILTASSACRAPPSRPRRDHLAPGGALLPPTYGFATLGAFAVVEPGPRHRWETTAIDRWAGLGKQSPVVAAVFAFFLLAMAGIPLTSGFVGKWAVFAVAPAAGAWPVVVAAVLTSVLAVFLDLRVIRPDDFDEPVGDGPTGVPVRADRDDHRLRGGWTLLLGILPGPVLDLAAVAGEFIR